MMLGNSIYYVSYTVGQLVTLSSQSDIDSHAAPCRC